MKLKFKEKPLVVCNYRIGMFLLFLPLYVFFYIYFTMFIIAGWNFYPPFGVLAFVMCVWGVLGVHLKFKIYSNGIVVHRLGFSRFLRWDEISYIHESKFVFPISREIIIGSKAFPLYRGLFGFSVRHMCPRVRLSNGVHRNFDEAREIILKNMEAIKARDIRKIDYVNAVKANNTRDSILDHIEMVKSETKSKR